jgi:hypothetical protein
MAKPKGIVTLGLLGVLLAWDMAKSNENASVHASNRSSKMTD